MAEQPNRPVVVMQAEGDDIAPRPSDTRRRDDDEEGKSNNCNS